MTKDPQQKSMPPSPVQGLLDNGIALFSTLEEVAPFSLPLTMSMTLLAVCVRGTISASVDMVERRMTARNIVVLRRGHEINNISVSDDFRGFFLSIEDAKLDALMPLSGSYLASCFVYFKDDPVVAVTQGELENLTLIHSLIQQKSRQYDRPYTRYSFDALCEALFYETLGIYTAAMRRSDHIPTRREELMSQFINLVDACFATERSVGFYARELCLSAKHLSSVVKRVSGLTASDWIDRKVILEAKRLLRTTPKTIQQIALELNFSNQSFFGKFFKNYTGVTPREFRTKHGGEAF